MLTISILGSNAPHCEKVERHIRTAMRWLEPQDGYEITRITRQDMISNYVTKTPALVINGVVACEGCIPAPQNIVTWASHAMQNELKQAAAVAVSVGSMVDAYGK